MTCLLQIVRLPSYLTEPRMAPVCEPSCKFRHTLQLDEIVPLPAGGVLLHLAL